MGETDSKGKDSKMTEENLTADRQDGSEDIAGSGVAAGEVRAVEPPPKKNSSALLLILLLLVLVGGGFYLLSNGLEQEATYVTEARTAAAKRYAITKQVEVVTIDQTRTVAATVSDQSGSEASVGNIAEQADVSTVRGSETIESAAEQISQPSGKAVAEIVVDATTENDVAEPEKAVEPSEKVPPVVSGPLYQVLIGPYLSRKSAEEAAEKLRSLGYETTETKGRGPVTMTRLLEGTYPPEEARKRLVAVKKKVSDAFFLPSGDKRAIYVGSFHDTDRAGDYIKALAKKGISVTTVSSELEMSGRMLVATTVEKDVAEKTAAELSAAGFSTQLAKK